MARKAPEEVFTPRAAKINERMFVPRPALEEALQDALKSSKYVVIHGESGNGKTWLYKKVFKQNRVQFETLNLADAISAGSLTAAIEHKLGALGHSAEEKYEEELVGGARPMNIGVEAKRRTTRKITPTNAFCVSEIVAPTSWKEIRCGDFRQLRARGQQGRRVAGDRCHRDFCRRRCCE